MKWISLTYRQNLLTFTLVTTALLVPVITEAKTVKTRSVQEVNFSEMNLKGTIRNPDGAYLVQKRGLKFQPLYKIQESFDKKIRETSFFIE
ncbi:MAG: hypothetical protein K2P92_02770 [Bdellovibrionaceae bacterium]|nr:hypothetical protein [Pseudobdellovibrionaceae bacterium]